MERGQRKRGVIYTQTLSQEGRHSDGTSNGRRTTLAEKRASASQIESPLPANLLFSRSARINLCSRSRRAWEEKNT